MSEVPPVSNGPLDEATLGALRHALRHSFSKIEHCVHQLSDEQLWQRPGEEMNAVANLLLHLAGNVRQWIIAGVGGAKDDRDRRGEFADRSNRSKDELLAKLRSTIEEADAVLARQDAKTLVAPKRIQGFDTTTIGAIVHGVSHFQGHTQEIIHMTRATLGDRYRYDFVPTPEQE